MREMHEDPFLSQRVVINEGNAQRSLLPEHIIINEGNAGRTLLPENIQIREMHENPFYQSTL